METSESAVVGNADSSPHSLGKSVEWKLFPVEAVEGRLIEIGPHSLGKSVEWKLVDAS